MQKFNSTMSDVDSYILAKARQEDEKLRDEERRYNTKVTIVFIAVAIAVSCASFIGLLYWMPVQ